MTNENVVDNGTDVDLDDDHIDSDTDCGGLTTTMRI